VHIRPVAITSLDFRRSYNYRNTADGFMIKDEIFARARQTKPLHLCLCVIKRERRFLPAELAAIELPIDLERGSHGRQSLGSTMLKDCVSIVLSIWMACSLDSSCHGPSSTRY